MINRPKVSPDQTYRGERENIYRKVKGTTLSETINLKFKLKIYNVLLFLPFSHITP